MGKGEARVTARAAVHSEAFVLTRDVFVAIKSDKGEGEGRQGDAARRLQALQSVPCLAQLPAGSLSRLPLTLALALTRTEAGSRAEPNPSPQQASPSPSPGTLSRLEAAATEVSLAPDANPCAETVDNWLLIITAGRPRSLHDI